MLQKQWVQVPGKVLKEGSLFQAPQAICLCLFLSDSERGGGEMGEGKEGGRGRGREGRGANASNV